MCTNAHTGRLRLQKTRTCNLAGVHRDMHVHMHAGSWVDRRLHRHVTQRMQREKRSHCGRHRLNAHVPTARVTSESSARVAHLYPSAHIIGNQFLGQTRSHKPGLASRQDVGAHCLGVWLCIVLGSVAHQLKTRGCTSYRCIVSGCTGTGPTFPVRWTSLRGGAAILENLTSIRVGTKLPGKLFQMTVHRLLVQQSLSTDVDR